MLKKLTFPVLLILILAYEIWAVLTPDKGDTISEIIWKLSDHSMLIPLAFGILLGHFFWPRKIHG